MFAKKKNIAVGGIVELSRYVQLSNEWIPINIGILYFQKDYQRKSYFFRLFDYKSDEKVDSPLWEAQMTDLLEYTQLNETFQYLLHQDEYIGFNFSSDQCASKFYKHVIKVKQEREKTSGPSLTDNKLFGGLFNRNKKANKFTHVKETFSNLVELSRMVNELAKQRSQEQTRPAVKVEPIQEYQEEYVHSEPVFVEPVKQKFELPVSNEATSINDEIKLFSKRNLRKVNSDRHVNNESGRDKLKNQLNNLLQGQTSKPALSETCKPKTGINKTENSISSPPPVPPRPKLKERVSTKPVETNSMPAPPPPPFLNSSLPTSSISLKPSSQVSGASSIASSYKSQTQDLLDSIKNFKGFSAPSKQASSCAVSSPRAVPAPKGIGLQDQLMRELEKKKAYLRQSSESDSSVDNW